MLDCYGVWDMSFFFSLWSHAVFEFCDDSWIIWTCYLSSVSVCVCVFLFTAEKILWLILSAFIFQLCIYFFIWCCCCCVLWRDVHSLQDQVPDRWGRVCLGSSRSACGQWEESGTHPYPLFLFLCVCIFCIFCLCVWACIFCSLSHSLRKIFFSLTYSLAYSLSVWTFAHLWLLLFLVCLLCITGGHW